jgi:V/A-type H+/Na+-transporting ATPase subunit B
VLVDQGQAERRDLGETLEPGWRALRVLPRRELTMLPAAQLDAHYPGPAGEGR